MHSSGLLLEDDVARDDRPWMRGVLCEAAAQLEAESRRDQDWLRNLPRRARDAVVRARSLARSWLAPRDEYERRAGPAARRRAMLLEDDPSSCQRAKYMASQIEHGRGLRVVEQVRRLATELFTAVRAAIIFELILQVFDELANRILVRPVPPPAIRARHIASVCLTPRLLSQRPLQVRC